MKIIQYNSFDGASLPMDIFFPDDWTPNDHRGAVVFFFGGWWMRGATAQFHPQARELARLGLVAIVPRYRVFLHNGTPVETAIRDAAAAVSFIFEHAGEWGIDPGKIAIGGGSAGAHVAISLLLLDWINTPLLNSIRALTVFNPVLDVVGIQEPNDALLHSSLERIDLSPLHHIRSNLPDMLFFQGDQDRTTPLTIAQQFVNSSLEKGNHCEFIIYPGRDHGFFNLREDNQIQDYYDTLGHIVQFLYEREFFKL